MKNKRLAIFLGILIFFAVIVVLSSTVFSLKSVELNFVEEAPALENSKAEIIDSGEFRYNESIFFVNKKAYISKIEKANPYIHVVNIETKFPNKLIIHAAQRQECYVLKLSTNKYAVTDEDMKVLNILDVYQNSNTNPIEIKNSGLAEQSVSAGDFFEVDDDYLTQIFKSFREWELSYSVLKQKIASIELNYEKPDKLLVNMHSGVQILIENSKVQISDKLNLAFSFYDTKKDKNGNDVDYTQGGIILITETDQKIYGLYKPV